MSNQLPPASGTPTSKKIPPSGSSPGRAWLTWIILGIVGLAVGYAIFVRPFLKPAATGRWADQNRPFPISAESAHQADLNVRLVALGTVTPVYTVTVRSRVDGELQKLFFTEGTAIEAGAPLAEVDPRPFEVQKMQAEAQLAKDQALLDNSRVDLARFQTLLDQDSVAKQQVDTQAALVRQYEAAIKVDQAQVETAALQLAYAHITAPISGRIGLRSVDQGNMIHASDANGIAVITQLHPITVLFSIPQDAVPKVMKRFKSGEVMEVVAFDRDGKTALATGRLVTVDNQIDPTTGTVKLRAEFANADEALFPNQFVNVQLVVEQLTGVTVVPNAAVQRGTGGTFVYVVTAQKTATVRLVETGPAEKGEIVVTKGLVPGELVVVDGVDKLREGSPVEIVSPAAAPAAGAAKPKWDKANGKRPVQN